MALIIQNQEHYDKVMEFAKSINDETLQPILDRLDKWEGDIYLSRDFEKHSFFFRQVYEDGRQGICGGVLYHGSPGEADNSCAVCIDGRAYGWRMHT